MNRRRTEMTIAVETRLLLQIEERTNPFKRLAAAVISQAVQDATNELGSTKRAAITWLDPDQCRQELSNLLASRTERVYVDFQSLLRPRGLQPTMVG
jgi:hypothetical protein